MKAYYEVETLSEALDLARKFQDGEYGILLVQNVYKSDSDSNCIVIKFKHQEMMKYEANLQHVW